jgi:EEF1A N-terminal glycine/lysine methyltransferase
MADQHVPLVHTVTQLLERSSSARVFMVAGLHTGRSVLSNFFRVAASKGLIPDDEDILEHNVTSEEARPWQAERIGEDVVERKQWLVLARLRWSNLTPT